jgi:uncharacterized protein YfaS (alpha-2-macroglobulin family)
MKNALQSFVLMFILLFGGSNLLAQENKYDDLFEKIDLLAEKQKARPALELIKEVGEKARKDGNTAMIIKSVMYSRLFQTYLNGNDLIPQINMLRQDVLVAKQPEKSILQSLLAETYWNYYTINAYKIGQRTQIENDSTSDVSTWAVKRILDEVQKNFEASLKEVSLLQNFPVSKLSGILKGDDKTRYLRPTLYDLLSHITLPIYRNTQLQILLTTDGKDTTFKERSKHIFQNMIGFYREAGNKGAYCDAELARLKYFKSEAYGFDTLYYRGLQKLESEAEGTELYTDILYELAKIYKEEATNPESKVGSLSKALALSEKAIKAFPNSVGAKNAENVIAEIKALSLTIQTNGNIPSDTPIELKYSYKNFDSLYVKIFKVSHQEAKGLYFNNFEVYQQFVTQRKAVRSWVEATTGPKDYLIHQQYSSNAGLPVGDYIIVAQSSAILDTLNRSLANTYAKIKVSNLVVNNKGSGQYMVMDAVDGHPVNGVKIQENIMWPNGTEDRDEKSHFTNKDGLLITSSKNVSSVLVSKGQDSVSTYTRTYYGDSSNDDEKIKVFLFTDRPIYRPGQTVFFKGIVWKKEHGKSRIVPGEHLKVSFEDVNGDGIADTSVVSNEYGTVQGSFVIPTGRRNGEMEISTDNGRVVVQVEEYKRPTFEIVFSPMLKEYYYNDSVKIAGLSKSLSGYPIGFAAVKYTIKGNGPAVIGNTTTDINGRFAFAFMPTNKKADRQEQGYFTLSLEVVDAAGETISAEKSFVVGSKRLISSVNNREESIFLNKIKPIKVYINTVNGLQAKAKINVTWHHLFFPGTYQSKFSDQKDKISNVRDWNSVKLPFEQNLTIENGAFELQLKPGDLAPGYYRRVITAVTNNLDSGVFESIFRVYSAEPETIQSKQEWVVLENPEVTAGDNVIFRIAGFKENSNVYYEVISKENVVEKGWLKTSPMQSLLRIPIKSSYEDKLTCQFIMVRDGLRYAVNKEVNIIDKKKDIYVKFLSFRDLLQPGEKESWKLKFSNGLGEKKMVELAATLYDAALDKFGNMRWGYYDNSFYYHSGWEANISEQYSSTKFYSLANNIVYRISSYRTYEQLNTYGYQYHGLYNVNFGNYLDLIPVERLKRFAIKANQRLALLENSNKFHGIVKDENGYGLPDIEIRINNRVVAVTNNTGVYAINAKRGDKVIFNSEEYISDTIQVANARRVDVILKLDVIQLNEITIRGYVKRTRETTTGASYVVSGKEIQDTRVSTVNQRLQGKVSGINIKNGNNQDDEKSNERFNAIVPRTNFSETAFFYPQLRTDSSGIINIEFTIPQSLTRYRMRGFAHTKEFETLYFSKELITQKQFAISANAPRFFRVGDSIVLAAKLNNMSGKKLTGKANLELRDALTGNVIRIFSATTPATQSFKTAENGSVVLNWSLLIPAGLQAITYKVVAESGKYSDGEENTIPVLSNSILVTEAIPLNVRGSSTKTFIMDKLLRSGNSSTLRNQSLTLEFTSNPIWNAIQALPYLMEYPYECAEQTMSRFYANSFATSILNSSPKIKQIFESWQKLGSNSFNSNLDKNSELKALLLEETPWLRNAGNEANKKKRLATLFDLNRMSGELKANFEKLADMQYADGSFPWFKGMPGNRYITQQIVLNLAQLKYLKMIDEKSFPEVNTLLNKAIIYLDHQLVKDFTSGSDFRGAYSTPMHYLYARSYTNQINNNELFNTAIKQALASITNDWAKMTTYEQGLAALVLHRNGKQKEAMKIVNSLKDRSQQKEEIGMYWPDNNLGSWWYQSPVETQALLVEVFDEVANDITSVEEMKIWLLKNKQNNNWKTTKATTASCYALLMRGYNLLEDSKEPEITLGGKTLSQLGLSEPTKEAGTGYRKIEIEGKAVKPDMGTVTVKNNNKGIAWGGLYWQYFEQADKITSAASGIIIKKELFLQSSTPSGMILTSLKKGNALKKGDLLKVRIEIRCDQPMEYLHLKDMRSAGFEPTNIISTYKYQDGLGYFESTKDASTNFFIDYMPKGVYIFEYPLRVNSSGNFSNGVTSLQSMYAPEYTTHSEGTRVSVK